MHALLEILRLGHPLPKGMGTRSERKLAQEGWKRIQAHAVV